MTDAPHERDERREAVTRVILSYVLKYEEGVGWAIHADGERITVCEGTYGESHKSAQRVAAELAADAILALIAAASPPPGEPTPEVIEAMARAHWEARSAIASNAPLITPWARLPESMRAERRDWMRAALAAQAGPSGGVVEAKRELVRQLTEASREQKVEAKRNFRAGGKVFAYHDGVAAGLMKAARLIEQRLPLEWEGSAAPPEASGGEEGR